MKTLLKSIATTIMCFIALSAFAQPSMDYNILIEDIEFQPGVTIDINVNVYVNENATNRADNGKLIAIEGMAHTANCMKPMAEEMFLRTDPQLEVNEFFAIDSPGKGLSGIPEGNGFMFDDLYFENYMDIFFGVIEYLNNDLGIYPRTIMGHSLGGLYVLKLQDTLVKQGTNLKEQFGITNTVLLAPVIPAPLEWSFIGSPLAEALLGYAEFFTPEYGSILNIPPEAWPFVLFTNTCCYFAPNTVPGAPTPEEVVANGLSGIEPAPMMLQITGMPIPPPLPYPYKPRISAKAGIFSPPNQVQLLMIADEFDRMMHPDEEEALYQYLTGDATLAHIHTIMGEETCHDTHISDPHAVVELLDIPLYPEVEPDGYTIVNDLFFSDALGAMESVDVWLPPGYNECSGRQFPVVYMLHKAFSDERSYEWFLPMLNQMVADGEIDPFIVVKPNGWAPPYLGSLWYHSVLYGNYEDMVRNDLINYIESTYSVLPGQDYRYHVGHSMGGHAGWSMAIRYPDLFASIADIGGYKNLDMTNDLLLPVILAENGGEPPYSFNPANGQLSALWFTLLGGYCPNLANPPFYVNVPVDENGNYIPEYMEQYLQDDIIAMIPDAEQPPDTKFWFAQGILDNVTPIPTVLAFKDTLDVYEWDYTFYTYNGGHFDVADPLAEAFRFIDGVWKTKLATQTVDVPQNWNLISTFLMPANLDVEAIFEVPVANGDLVFGFNSNGIFWPGYNINTMGLWCTKQAIKVKAANPFSFDINGVAWQDKSVALKQGINYLPVLSENAVAATDIFGQMGDDLLYAFDITDMLIYWPQGGLFTLETFVPGKGYLVSSLSDVTVVFTDDPKNSVTPSGTSKITNRPLSSNNTGVQHIIVVPADLLNNFRPGTLLSVVDDSGHPWAISKLEVLNQPLVLVVAGDDAVTETTDGMTDGSVMMLKAQAPDGEVFELSVTYDTGVGNDGIFKSNAISLVSNLKSTTNINTMESQFTMLVSPNPASEKVTISWYNQNDGLVNLSLLNIHGQYLETIVSENFRQGAKRFTWNTSHLTQGIYLLRIKAGNNLRIQKLLIVN